MGIAGSLENVILGHFYFVFSLVYAIFANVKMAEMRVMPMK
jgi:hypothetical protein